MVLCSYVPPERTFFFSPPTPRLWSSRVSMSPLGLRRVGPDRPALVCLPSARLFYWIPRGPPTAVFLAWRCEGFFFFFFVACVGSVVLLLLGSSVLRFVDRCGVIALCSFGPEA